MENRFERLLELSDRWWKLAKQYQNFAAAYMDCSEELRSELEKLKREEELKAIENGK